MTTTRLLTSTVRLTTIALCTATLLLVPQGGTAQAAGSRPAAMPAPARSASVDVVTLGLDDHIAQRKAAWAAHRTEHHLF